jgi:hypothetical protein
MLADYFQSYGLRIVGEADVRMLFGSLSFNVVSNTGNSHASGITRSCSKAKTPNAKYCSGRAFDANFWQTDQSQTSARALTEIGSKTSVNYSKASGIINI